MAKEKDNKNNVAPVSKKPIVSVIPEQPINLELIKAELVELLNNLDFSNYRKRVLELSSKGMVASVTTTGNIEKFDPTKDHNAIVIVSPRYFDPEQTNTQNQEDQNIDSAIIVAVKDLPAFFLQGGALIKKSVIATDEIAMSQRSWHQLPSPHTMEIIQALDDISSSIEAFKGKILL